MTRKGLFTAAGVLLAAGAAIGAGCGGGDSPAAATSAEASTGTGTGAGGGGQGGGSDAIACTGQPATLSLGGVWAARGVLDVTLQGKPGGAVTTCPADQHGASSLLLMLTFEEDPSDATKLSSVNATLCSLELPTVTALVGDCLPNPTNLLTAQIVAPQAFIDALPEIATQAVEGQLDGTAPGANIALDRFTVTVGSSKTGAALPSWDTTVQACNDPSIGRQAKCEGTCVDDCAGLTDDDHDGNPGVTINVCGFTENDMNAGVPCNAEDPTMPGSVLQGQGFLDIQVDPQFSGQAKSSCEIDGDVDTDVLYNLIGGNVYLASSPISVTAAIGSLPEFQVQVAGSKFRMVRVDGKFGAPSWSIDPTDPKAACATVIQRQNEL